MNIAVHILARLIDCIGCAALSSPGLVVHIVSIVISSESGVQALTDKTQECQRVVEGGGLGTK